MKELTQRQRQVLDFVKGCLNQGRSLPSMREIALELRLTSSSSSHAHVEALVRKGWLERMEGGARLLRLVEDPDEKRLRGVALVGEIPAGRADGRMERMERMVYVDLGELRIPKGNRVFALRVSGDSMIGRHILDGDIVILEQGAEVRHHDVVAALIDGESTLKTFVQEGRRVFLRAENPLYPDLIPVGELMIQGVMRMVIRERPARV